MLQCVAVCCSVLQRVAVCCSNEERRASTDTQPFTNVSMSGVQCIYTDTHTHTQTFMRMSYGVAMVSRIDKLLGLFRRILSLL